MKWFFVFLMFFATIGEVSAQVVFSIPTGFNPTPKNISGTILTGGTPQLLIAAATQGTIRHVIIQNLSTDPECFSFFTVTPSCGAAGTFILKAASGTGTGDGGSYTTPPGFNDSNAVYIVGSTNGDAFTVSSQ